MYLNGWQGNEKWYIDTVEYCCNEKWNHKICRWRVGGRKDPFIWDNMEPEKKMLLGLSHLLFPAPSLQMWVYNLESVPKQGK